MATNAILTRWACHCACAWAAAAGRLHARAAGHGCARTLSQPAPPQLPHAATTPPRRDASMRTGHAWLWQNHDMADVMLQFEVDVDEEGDEGGGGGGLMVGWCCRCLCGGQRGQMGAVTGGAGTGGASLRALRLPSLSMRVCHQRTNCARPSAHVCVRQDVCMRCGGCADVSLPTWEWDFEPSGRSSSSPAGLHAAAAAAACLGQGGAGGSRGDKRRAHMGDGRFPQRSNHFPPAHTHMLMHALSHTHTHTLLGSVPDH